MDKNVLKGLASAYQQVLEAMDPVNKKELKGDHKDRKDKDIDNDGDVDSSDEYLHKRRKAISKSKKKDGEGEVNMDPKMAKESKIRVALKSIFEKKDNHNPNKDKAEKPEDALSGKGAKDMMALPKDIDDTEEKGHQDAVDATRVTKPAKARNGGDAVRSGDQKVVSKIAAAYKAMQK